MQGTGDGTVTQTVARLPGMAMGEVGLAGVDKPGPTIRTVAIPPWQFIGVELLWVYIGSFLSIMSMDGLGLVDLAPAGDALAHFRTIGSLAVGPAAFKLIQELYDYLGKVRASRT